MKRFICLLLCAAMAASMAACGGGGASGSSGSGAAGESAGTSESPSAAKEEKSGTGSEVVLYTWWADAERTMGEALISDFETAHPEIKVQQNYVSYSDYLSKINTMAAASSVPDIFYLNEYLITEWGEKGVGQDLMPHYKEAGIDPKEFYVDTALYTSGDKLWGVNFTSTTTCLYYNKEMFTEAGVELPPSSASNPWSWDAYVEAAKKLSKDSSGLTPNDAGFNYNSLVQYGTVMPTSWIYVLPLLYAGGASVANEDGTELMITKEAGVKVLQNIADLALVHKVAPTIAMSQDSVFSNLPVMLMNKQLGMFIGGTFQFSDFNNEDYDVGIAQIPSMSGKGSNMAWSSGFMMGANAKPGSFELFEYLLDFNNSVAASKNHNVGLTGLPQTNSTFDDPEKNAAWIEVFDETMADVAGDILQNGSRLGENVTVKNFAVIMDQTLTPQFDKIWLGEITAAEAMSTMDEALAGRLQGVWA